MPNVWDAMKRHSVEKGGGQEVLGPSDQSEEDSLGRQSIDLSDTFQPGRRISLPPQLEPEAAKRYSKLIRTCHERGGSIAEEYRSLRTNLLSSAEDGKISRVITSANKGEGKSVSASNLAAVLAERPGKFTLLADFDMRRGRIAKLFNTEKSPGIAEVLRGETDLLEAIQATALPNLYILPTGSVKREEVGTLISAREVRKMIAQAKSCFDYVIWDTPPINAVADAGVIGQLAGEALLVVRLNKTRKECVARAIRLLRSARVDVGGIILTHRRYYIPNYLYRYS
ncbi:MAG: CpsD/CapB family tyrosine-protein kinase [Phycisphaerae bacterium]